MTLDSTKWASSSDGDLQPQPVVASTLFDGNTNLEVTLRQNAGDGPLMISAASREKLDARLEKSSPPERHTIGELAFVGWSERYVQKSPNNTPPWTAEEGKDPFFLMGFADYVKLGTPSSASGFVVELSTPYAWWDLDLAELLFAWVRFYSGGGTTARDMLDKQALLDYSARCVSFITGVRMWAWREVDKQIDDHLLELAAQAGAMVGWGGFNDAQTKGRLGLRLLHLDDLEVSTLPQVHIDVGREWLLTEEPDFRTAAEYILNAWRTYWGGGVVATNEGQQVGSAVDVLPFKTIADSNVLEYEDSTSQTDYGIHNVERELSNITEEPYAENTQRPFWWTDLPSVVQLPFGPLHLDFDPGAILTNIVSPRHGLDGTEELLVLRKVERLLAHDAVVECLLLDRKDYPSVTPSTPDDLILWLKGDTGITLFSGGPDIDAWADQSSEGNDASFTARLVAERRPEQVTNGLNSMNTVTFDDGSGSNCCLDLNGFSGGADEGFGKTIIALIKIPSSSRLVGLNHQMLMHYANSGNSDEFGFGIINKGTSGNFTYGFRLNGTAYYDANTSVHANDSWQILVFTLSRHSNGEKYRMQVADSAFEVFLTDNSPSTNDDLDTDFQDDIALATDGDLTPYDFYGEMAELCVWNKQLLPSEIRGVCRYLKDRWGL